jgi:HAE1 family hydrophobic/amphiphilic exporter-1
MGQAVIGGIVTSSLLTLVVVPVVYTYLDDFSRVIGGWIKRRTGAPEPAAPTNGVASGDGLEPARVARVTEREELTASR